MSNYIDAISQVSTASGTNTGSSATNTDEILGKEDFLTLLVAQLQNQDPLNPDDPTEFTAQLAQFSSLEQLFNINEGMENLVTANANSDRLSTLNTIGKEVAYQSSSFSYSGEPVTLGYQLDGQASEVTLALQLNGATVALLQGEDLTKGTHYLNWDGITESGRQAAHGDYKIIVQAKAAEGESVAASPVIRSEVTGVDLEGEFGGTLVTKAGEVAFNTILGVYEVGSAIASEETEEENSSDEPNDETTTADTVAGTVVDAAADLPEETLG